MGAGAQRWWRESTFVAEATEWLEFHSARLVWRIAKASRREMEAIRRDSTAIRLMKQVIRG